MIQAYAKHVPAYCYQTVRGCKQREHLTKITLPRFMFVSQSAGTETDYNPTAKIYYKNQSQAPSQPAPLHPHRLNQIFVSTQPSTATHCQPEYPSLPVLIKYVEFPNPLLRRSLQFTSVSLDFLHTDFRSRAQPPNMKTTALYAIFSFGFGALAAPAPAAEPVPAVAHALEARSGEYRGGIDVNTACRVQYGLNYYAKSVGITCNDWKCTNGGGLKSMDTPKACSYQYGLNVYAFCSSGVNGWGCYNS